MRRIVVIALSAIMGLVVAIPMASGLETRNLADLTADWWNWASATSPSPLEGSYTGGTQCEGEYVEGVFFLAGSAFGENKVERTCTVPADTPIFFPIVNVVCSEAFTGLQPEPDPKPLDTACAQPFTTDTIEPPSKWSATLDKQDLEQQRIASGLFDWTIVFPNNPFPGFVPGTYESATDGLWVYLEEGLPAGEHTIVFGGKFKDTPFGHFKGTRVTYKLTAQ